MTTPDPLTLVALGGNQLEGTFGVTARRGLMARLRYGAGVTVLACDADGLFASGADGDRRIAYSDALQSLTAIRGLFWASVSASTRNGFIMLPGFPRAPLERLVASFNAGLQAAARERFDAAEPALAHARAQADELLSQSSYVRDRPRVEVDAAVRSAVAVQHDALWSAYASPAQRDEVAVLDSYLLRSKELLAESNGRFVESQLAAYQEFFDSIESNPLTGPQRQACVVNEERNLVLAGAGTGKTSVMIGRAGYLVASKEAEPAQILMLAYARKAMEEMQERQDARLGDLLGESTPRIKTFHALGLEIIGEAEGRRPDITPMSEDARLFARFIDEQVQALGTEPNYRRMLVRYHYSERFPHRTPFDFDDMREYDEYVRTNELVTLKGEAVKSHEEVVVANFLSAHGLAYEYERPYPVDTATPLRRQYKPDFYLPAWNIYIEHFALDRNGHAPAHFRGYADGVKWKREVHKKYDTTLIETHSYMKSEGILESTLEAQLRSAGVDLVQRSDEELLQELRATMQCSYFAKLVADFVALFKESELSLAELRGSAEGGPDRARHTLLLDLIEPILVRYQNQLAERGQIDFADMITLATKHVAEGRYSSPYTHILVDEFQDISRSRMRLLVALLGNVQDSTLFAVGDDWQAIYGFAGSDVAFTREFEQRLGTAATTVLDTTFRFNDQIGTVASRFVQQNPEQIPKSMRSLVQVNEPAVSLLGVADAAAGLRLCAQSIANRADQVTGRKATVLVLSRYNFSHEGLSSSPEAKAIKADFPKLDFRFMSMHAAKGKEADFVVAVGLQSGKNGFPCQKPVDRFLEPLLPTVGSFKYAEERRLFYVAITRARHRSYVIYDPDKPSAFIVELLDAEPPYPIAVDEFESSVARADIIPVKCPRCGDGTLVRRQGPTGTFAGCSNYPYCRYTGPVCARCAGLVRIVGGKGSCSNPECGAAVSICPKCGGVMRERKGRGGSRFLGCSNYGTKGCDHTERLASQK